MLSESEAPPPMTAENLARLDEIPNIIDGNTTGKPPVRFVVNVEITGQDQLDLIRDKRLFVHLFGAIVYEDTLQSKVIHRTPFRYRWLSDEETFEDSILDTSHWIPWGPWEDNEAT